MKAPTKPKAGKSAKTEALWEPSRGFVRGLILVLGIFLGQAVLYGPSLVGHKILLPLDFLSQPGILIPPSDSIVPALPHDRVLMDLAVLGEPERQFIGKELRSGKLPGWNPGYFAGAPVSFPWLSPLALLRAWISSPVIVAWFSVLQALVAGTGFYVFCRWVLKLGFWPSAVAAWCYPVTGFYVLWQGYGVTWPVQWLPWMLSFIYAGVLEKRKWAGPAVACLTGVILTSGQLDMGGLTLLASGLFAVACLGKKVWDVGWRGEWWRHALVLALAWGVGFLLSAVYLKPVLDYSRTGSRMEKRAQGAEERPPVGLAALPQTFFPRMYGSTQRGSLPLFPERQGNVLESSAAAYSGLLALAFLIPLAWSSRPHRFMNGVMLGLAFLGMAWSLNVPGLVDMLRLPGLNMMSHNRFVFLTGFAVLASAAVGLEQLIRPGRWWRSWHWLLIALLAGGLYWNLDRWGELQTYFGVTVTEALQRGQSLGPIQNAAQLAEVSDWFRTAQIGMAGLCALGILAWGMVRFSVVTAPFRIGLVGLVLMGELLWFGYGQSAQADPALYYPEVPVLKELARDTTHRVIGYSCLPARLAETMGLQDIRGYDAIDPVRLINVLSLAADANSPQISYAQTQWMVPKFEFTPPDQLKLHPVLDMLAVGHVIFRGQPAPGVQPEFQGPDYWVLKNPRALSRVYIPRRVETVHEDRERLEKMNLSDFDPRQVAYVETTVPVDGLVQGTGRLVLDEPSHVVVEAEVDRPGLLVLADRWDPGWSATMEGKAVPILRANHILRGVVLPAGRSRVEFVYASPWWNGGGLVSLLGLGILAVWVVVFWRQKQRDLPGVVTH